MVKLVRNIAIAVAILLVILIAIPFFINVNSFRPKIESELSSALGRKAEVGDLSLSILSGSVSAANIVIADDPAFSKSPFITAKSLKIGIELIPLIFSKQLNVTGITLDEPSIVLLSGPRGTWNFSSLGGNAPKAGTKRSSTGLTDFSVAEIKVTDGKLQVGKANAPSKLQTFDKVNINVKDFSSTTQFPFTMSANLPGGGDLKLEGKAGPITAAETPLQATVKIEKLDLSSVVTDPREGVGGLGSFDGTLDSNGNTAKASGTLTADKLKLSPKGTPAGHPVQVKFATDYDLKRQSGTLSQGDISMGKAVAHLTGKYQTEGEATVLNMKLDGQGMPVDDLESMLPALGVTLPSGSGLKGGTLSTTLGIAGPTDKLVITGPVKLENSQLVGFDMGSKLSALSAFTGKAASSKDTTIQNCSANVRVAPEGTRADAINLTVPSLGVVTGAGTVSPEGALNFKMSANLSGGAAGGLTQLAGLGGGKGGGGIPFLITGTTSNPRFEPDLKGMTGSALQQALGGKSNSQSQNPVGALEGLLKKKP